MKVLVLNCGSSSLKYQLFDMADESVLSKGLVERIGIEGSRIKHSKTGADARVVESSIPDHTKAISMVLDLLLDTEVGSLKNLSELEAVGHRVVHGGEKFTASALVTPEVLKGIEACIPLAPLHNPANLMGIEAMQKALPSVPNVVVFDTAFHQTMPPHAYIYGVPYKYYEEKKVRRYSFHGTSHFYVAHRAAALLGKPIEDLKLVTCHLGNGSSVTAVDGGKSVDSSLGMGTTSGVLMGTRCGDVDGSVMIALMEENPDPKRVSDIIHKESGVLGISGLSSDMRDVEGAAEKGDARAKLAVDIVCYTIKKYIAAYAAAMGGVDAVVFTAGVGENSDVVRAGATKGLEFMGIKLDLEKNNTRGKEAIISTDDSKVKVLIVPTNEELVIARDTKTLVKR